jgi:phage terminase large subunit-like protein
MPRAGLTDLCRETIPFPLHDWQTNHLIPICERLKHEKGLRILIHAPPQYGKSIIVSMRLPADLIGNDPLHRVALMTFSKDKSEMFGFVVREIMRSQAYRDLYPDPLSHIPNFSQVEQFSTFGRQAMLDGQPSFICLGLNAGFPGLGPDTLIIDDPYGSIQDAESEAHNRHLRRVYDNNIKPRTEKTNILVMFHRWALNDFAGHLLDSGKFEYYRFPAIADDNLDGADPTGREKGELLSPIREREWLEELETEDPRFFLGHFQGLPRAESGDKFLREWFNIGECPPIRNWVRYWDIAVTKNQRSDYTAGCLMGIDQNQNVWIRDMVHFRAEWPDAADKICEVTVADLANYAVSGKSYRVGIDARLSQIGFVQELFRRPIFKEAPEAPWITQTETHRAQLFPDRSGGDKLERAAGLRVRGKSGQLFLHRNIEWNEKFIAEAIGFSGLPNDGHDDQVDAASGAYAMLWSRPGENVHETSQARNPFSPYHEAKIFGLPSPDEWNFSDDDE